MTVNQARAATTIAPVMDLARYAGFFALFEDFQGYVDFFLLQDFVSSDYAAVRFFMPFNDFNPPAIPRDLDAYLEFRPLSIEFTQARNRVSTNWRWTWTGRRHWGGCLLRVRRLTHFVGGCP